MPSVNGSLPASLVLSGILLFSAACKVAPPGRVETAVADDVKRYVTVRGKADRSPLAGTLSMLLSNSCVVAELFPLDLPCLYRSAS
ncbi:MAG: hypothetical protein ROO76_03830 [Terriglobia bacterium]|jgi:hypothetical protein|nr:hypothetical protein [Terriglobia bacterium]